MWLAGLEFDTPALDRLSDSLSCHFRPARLAFCPLLDCCAFSRRQRASSSRLGPVCCWIPEFCLRGGTIKHLFHSTMCLPLSLSTSSCRGKKKPKPTKLKKKNQQKKTKNKANKRDLFNRHPHCYSAQVVLFSATCRCKQRSALSRDCFLPARRTQRKRRAMTQRFGGVASSLPWLAGRLASWLVSWPMLQTVC